MKFLQVLEDIGEGVEAVAKFPFTTGGKLVALIKTEQADAPALISAVDGLIAAGAALGGDAAIEIAADGTNIGEYIKALNDAKTFAAYFKGTFLPAVEKIISDAKQDFAPSSDPAPAKAAGPAASAPAPSGAAVEGKGLGPVAAGAKQSGPGLDKTVPA